MELLGLCFRPCTRILVLTVAAQARTKGLESFTMRTNEHMELGPRSPVDELEEEAQETISSLRAEVTKRAREVARAGEVLR